MGKAILSLSGGMDSTTVLTWLLRHNYQVYPVQFQYGSKHNRYEAKAVKDVMAHYCDHPFLHDLVTIDLSGAFHDFKSNLLKSGGDIPDGHYEDKTMERTVIPGRNIIFLSVLAGYAWSIGAGHIALGIHQGDHAVYADCRKEFFKAIDTAIYLGTDRRVDILAPFVGTDKGGIANYGLDNGTPYRLTRTCYKDQERACAKCGACCERAHAFGFNRVRDPIEYADMETYGRYWEAGREKANV